MIIPEHDLSIQEKSSSGELPNAVHRQRALRVVKVQASVELFTE